MNRESTVGLVVRASPVWTDSTYRWSRNRPIRASFVLLDRLANEGHPDKWYAVQRLFGPQTIQWYIKIFRDVPASQVNQVTPACRVDLVNTARSDHLVRKATPARPVIRDKRAKRETTRLAEPESKDHLDQSVHGALKDLPDRTEPRQIILDLQDESENKDHLDLPGDEANRDLLDHPDLQEPKDLTAAIVRHLAAFRKLLHHQYPTFRWPVEATEIVGIKQYFLIPRYLIGFNCFFYNRTGFC